MLRPENTMAHAHMPKRFPFRRATFGVPLSPVIL